MFMSSFKGVLEIFCSLWFAFYISLPGPVAKSLSNMGSVSFRFQLVLASGRPGRRLNEGKKSEINVLIFLAPSLLGQLKLVVSSTLKDKAFIKCIFYIIVLGLIVSTPNLCHSQNLRCDLIWI